MGQADRHEILSFVRASGVGVRLRGRRISFRLKNDWGDFGILVVGARPHDDRRHGVLCVGAHSEHSHQGLDWRRRIASNSVKGEDEEMQAILLPRVRWARVTYSGSHGAVLARALERHQ